jgi:predicted NAD/FAD-dependent oxidoreductase
MSPPRRAEVVVVGAGLAGLSATRLADEIARLHGVAARDLEHLTTVDVAGAQPAARRPLRLRQEVDLGDGVVVCGDHRDTPSIQGAMASGARCARAVLRAQRPALRGAA